jgi:hypothetical protein
MWGRRVGWVGGCATAANIARSATTDPIAAKSAAADVFRARFGCATRQRVLQSVAAAHRR